MAAGWAIVTFSRWSWRKAAFRRFGVSVGALLISGRDKFQLCGRSVAYRIHHAGLRAQQSSPPPATASVQRSLLFSRLY